MTEQSQSGILAPVPRTARYLFFSLAQAAQLQVCLSRLVRFEREADALVVGIGLETLQALGPAVAGRITGMREFPAMHGPGAEVPSTPVALWCWLRADETGDLVHNSRKLEHLLAPAFQLDQVVDAFRYRQGANGHGRDLTGYEDGTENPQGDDAVEAALVQGQGASLDGSSFVAVQQWRHDFLAFEALAAEARDHVMGRRLGDNEELDEAPISAHVKRTAQESFTPEAFVWRRSMPWSTGRDAGLMFVAFGKSLDAYEAQMRRMAGLEDGMVDGLFGMSRPITGSYFWCPPVHDGVLDLRLLAG